MAWVVVTRGTRSQVLADFRAYKFNVLVATSIGEEGLDIPSVDLCVCLDVSQSPTRSTQREGRTGRHRNGRVVYVLSEGREDANYERGLQARSLLHLWWLCSHCSPMSTACVWTSCSL